MTFYFILFFSNKNEDWFWPTTEMKYNYVLSYKEWIIFFIVLGVTSVTSVWCLQYFPPKNHFYDLFPVIFLWVHWPHSLKHNHSILINEALQTQELCPTRCDNSYPEVTDQIWHYFWSNRRNLLLLAWHLFLLGKVFCRWYFSCK